MSCQGLCNAILNEALPLSLIEVKHPVGKNFATSFLFRYMIDELPLLALNIAHCKEVKEDHVVEFETFSLIDSKAEHTTHESWQLVFGTLLTNYYDLTCAEVRSS